MTLFKLVPKVFLLPVTILSNVKSLGMSLAFKEAPSLTYILSKLFEFPSYWSEIPKKGPLVNTFMNEVLVR